MAKRDYYEVLGLKKGVGKDEIKKSYRKLAKEFHPDKNKSTDAESRFKEVQEAYDVLSDEQKRQAYDQYGFAGTEAYSAPGSSPFGGMGGFDSTSFSGDLGDLLGNFFGGSFGGYDFGGSSRRSRSRGDSVGESLEFNLQLEFMEAVFGVEKEIMYKRDIECSSCHGTGSKDGKKQSCATCNGRGQVRQVQNTFFGAMQVVTDCPTCHGRGDVASEECPKCTGKGIVSSKETLKIKIPAGIPDGVTLRFNKKGSAGKRGAGYGDLFITIEVKPHPVLERRGDDIYMEKEIDVVTAVLGGEVKIPTVHGDVFMKVPEGSQYGKLLRLKEKGAPRFKGKGMGDEYVKLKIKIPDKLSKKERAVWENLKNL